MCIRDRVEETESEPPTLEMERPVQTADEIEEQTVEEPIQMAVSYTHLDVYKRQV